MSDTVKGILAMVAACVIWGLSPLFYKLIAHVPPPEVLAHRTVWSVVFFAGVLAVQGRLGALRAAFVGRRQVGLIAVAAVMISINWFSFILSIQIGRATEASLGYYIFPLIAVVTGWFWFSERLGRAQWLAVALAALAVCVLTYGLGAAPWIALIVSTTFTLYGALKKGLPLGPVVSVTAEILILMPLWLVVLAWYHGTGQGAFGAQTQTSLLLILSGPMTAMPLILFSFAARRVALSTVGLLQYINPTLQFFCAVVIFGEPFTPWHAAAFSMIWVALAVFSVAALRQDRAARA
ncbi:MAG: EamA family transporter RarD [Ruegeria sp.]|uniref:EamA family transporter RarD n=1 Tax=Ruegeria sp. TaxID=1879320 RepID=UPI00349E50C5